MRRRRHKLEVSTFPFLAVLLCAMGSLILLLLVLDRRAKAAARERAYKAAEQVAAKELQSAEEQKQEWGKRREALHAELVAQERELTAQITAAEKQFAAAQSDQTTEQERRRRERERLRHEEELISRLEEAVRIRRAESAGGDKKAAASGQEMQQLSRELRGLERTLEELKALRKRQQQTYSVVPYRGNHGDDRAPLYLECAASGLIFHPDRKTISVPRIAGEEIKAEVRARIVQQRVALKAAGRAPDDKPYLLMLIRPDGISAYYQTLHALNGLDLDFGYELIDADWVLEFPVDGERFKAQPWMTADKEAVKPGDPSRVLRPAPVGINRAAQGGIWANAPQNGGGKPGAGLPAAGGSNYPGGGPGRITGTGTGSGSGPAMTRAAMPIGPGMRSGPAVGTGSQPAADPGGAPGGLAMRPVGVDSGGSQGGFGLPTGGGQPIGADNGPVSGSGPSSPGTNRGTGQATGGSSGNTGGGIPSVPPLIAAGPAVPFMGARPQAAAISGDSPVLGGTGGSGGQGSAGSEAAAGTGSTGTPGANGSTDAGGSAEAPAASNSPGGEPHSPTPVPSAGRVHEIKSGDTGMSQNDAADNQPNPSNDGGRRAPLQGVDNDFLKPKKPAKRQELRPALLGGDRDYIIMLECRRNSVVLYPYGNSFSTESLAAKNGGGVILVDAIKRMIARKQTAVRAGEQPYRPQVRFMVRPDGLQSMHRVYPRLEELHIPLTRQNLDADEDVRPGD
jgi:hypothetical protein